MAKKNPFELTNKDLANIGRDAFGPSSDPPELLPVGLDSAAVLKSYEELVTHAAQVAEARRKDAAESQGADLGPDPTEATAEIAQKKTRRRSSPKKRSAVRAARLARDRLGRTKREIDSDVEDSALPRLFESSSD